MRDIIWFGFAIFALIMATADKPNEQFWLIACVLFMIGSGIVSEIKKAARK